jgi:hypothetical protein
MNPKVAGAHAATLIAALLPAACMQTVVLDHPRTDGGRGDADAEADSSDNDATGGGDGSNDHGLHCVVGDTRPLTVSQDVPSIFIALDRSSTMRAPLGTNGSRFTVTRDAIEKVLMTFGPLVQFGYVEFPGLPSDNDCMNIYSCCASVTTSLVRAGTSLMGITSMLNRCDQGTQVNCLPNSPDARPIIQAISRIEMAYTGLPRNTGPLYALLITGGEPTCSAQQGPDPAVCAQTGFAINNLLVSSSNPHFSTFVVGVGDVAGALNASNTGNQCLDDLAQAGGLLRDSGPPFYYPATTDPLVHSYLNTIVSGTVCRINIDDSNFDSDPAQIEVNLNGTIPYDPTNQNGWNINKSQITIYGPACATFVTNLTTTSRQLVVKGCNDPRPN